MEGVHATLCTILSDAMEGGFLDHTPAWRTYHYTGKKKEKVIAGEATAQQLIAVLQEFQREFAWETETYDGRELEDTDYIFRRHGDRLPMTPSTFAWRFKLILKKHGLPPALNVHSLRHTNASLLIAGGADVATVAGLLGATVSPPLRWTSTHTHLIRTRKRPVRFCRRDWRFDEIQRNETAADPRQPLRLVRIV